MAATREQRYGAISAAGVAALDAAAAELGVDVLQLMELAGLQVARLAWRMLGSRPRRVHVAAGHGNNGGDGLVAARHLAAWGCAVSATVHAEPDRLTGAAGHQARAARLTGVEVTVSNEDAGPTQAHDAALLIDALLGTGLSGPPRPHHAAVIAAMRGPVLSIDVPSGLDADSGRPLSAAVRATATCTLAACKRGFWAPASRAWTGELFVADIAMPRAAWSRCGLVAPSAVRAGTVRRVPEPGRGGR